MQQQGIIDGPNIEDVIISLQDLSVDQLQVSCRLDEMEDISAQPTTDHYDSDLQQLLINGAFYPYKIIGDNIDKKVKKLCIMNENYDD